MRILVGLLFCLLFIPLPVYADSGISDNITMTVSVVNESSYYDHGFDPGGSYSYSPPDWTKIFPSMLTTTTDAPISFAPPVQPPVETPPTYTINQPEVTVPPVVPYVPDTTKEDEQRGVMIGMFIFLGVIVIGLIIYALMPQSKPKG